MPSINALLEHEAHVDRLLKDMTMPTTKAIKFNTTMKVDELEITVGKKLGDGDICELWNVTYEGPATEHAGGSRFDRILDDDDGSSTRGVLKHAADPGDEDLVENEAKILTQLYPKEAKDEKFYRYLPRPLATFKASAGPRVMQMVLLPFLENYYSLAEVLAAYPNGLPSWEDAVWMLNRTMEGLGFVHRRNVVHGAIIPEHVMVHPTGHGAKLIDWSYATECHDKADARVRAMVKARSSYYAPEVTNRERVGPSSDMFGVGKLGIALVGGNVDTNEMPDSVPVTVQKFLKNCAETARSHRTNNAWDARDEFEEIVVAIVGRRRYRPFTMPKTP